MQSRLRRQLLAALALPSLTANASAAPGKGDVPPPSIGVDLNDEPVLLTSFPGKAIVVSFWATWCPYCLKELPILNNIQRAAGKDQMHVVAVNTETRDVFRKVVRAMSSLDLHHAHDSDGNGRAAFGVNGIPHMVIIGKDGKIVSVYRGYNESSLDDIVKDINRALATKA